MPPLPLAPLLTADFAPEAPRLPGGFYQLLPTELPPEQRVYYVGAACGYYRARNYRLDAFYRPVSRSVNYEQSFEFEEIP